MKTIAELIGEPEDPLVEEVRAIFSRQSAAINWNITSSPLKWRKMEWEAAKEIVEAVKKHLKENPDGTDSL